MHGKYLIFLVGDASFGIEIRHVMEIIGVQEITPVPHTHEYVKGIINLRGTIIPVVDIELRFGYEEKAYTDRTCIIVLHMDNMSIGLIVDEVRDVVFIDDENIQPPPRAGEDGLKNTFVKSIGLADGEIEQMLDIRKIFDDEESA
jgi:purine-binding chemotaxis protein CheW